METLIKMVSHNLTVPSFEELAKCLHSEFLKRRERKDREKKERERSKGSGERERR